MIVILFSLLLVSALALIPRDNDGDIPDRILVPPAPPAPPVSYPQIVIQFKGMCGTQGDNIVKSLRTALLKKIPSADAQYACQNGTQTVGIWHSGPKGSDSATARMNGLSKTHILTGSEAFAMTIRPAFYQAVVAEIWKDIPKKNGSISLNSYKLSFPSKIVFTISGKKSIDWWPDVTFDVTSTDTLTLANQRITCSNNVDFDIDRGFFSFVLYPIMEPIMRVLEHLFEDDAESTFDEGTCKFGSIIPKSIPLSPFLPGFKIDLLYSRLKVSTAGVEVGGQFALVKRTPSIRVRVEPYNQRGSEATFTIIPTEAVAPFKVAYSAPGASPSSGSRTFPRTILNPQLSFSWTISESVTKRVNFTLTDAEGLTATASASVSFIRGCPKNLPNCVDQFLQNNETLLP